MDSFGEGSRNSAVALTTRLTLGPFRNYCLDGSFGEGVRESSGVWLGTQVHVRGSFCEVRENLLEHGQGAPCLGFFGI